MKYLNEKKLEKIKINKENLYVVIDFDKTITSKTSTDSWDASGKLLEKDFHLKLDRLYKKYGPIEVDYKISFEEKNIAMINWYQQCMDLYYTYNLTKKKLNESIEISHLTFRSGAKTFLKNINENDITVIILSAGIGNVIEKFLRDNKCYYKNMLIISNFIVFDEDGNMKKFDNDMIHSLNKNIKGKIPHEFEEKIRKRTQRLVLGDLIEDKNMVDVKEGKDIISVGFLNKNIAENLKIYKEKFDIVLTNEDANFDVVEKILF